jgi:hypothetical protein
MIWLLQICRYFPECSFSDSSHMLSHYSVFFNISGVISLSLAVAEVLPNIIFSSFDEADAESLLCTCRCSLRIGEVKVLLVCMLDKICLTSAGSSRRVLLSFVMFCLITIISSPNFESEFATELTSSSSTRCSRAHTVFCQFRVYWC